MDSYWDRRVVLGVRPGWGTCRHTTWVDSTIIANQEQWQCPLTACLLTQHKPAGQCGVYHLKDPYLQISCWVPYFRTKSSIITLSLSPWTDRKNYEKSKKWSKNYPLEGTLVMTYSFNYHPENKKTLAQRVLLTFPEALTSKNRNALDSPFTN